MTRQKQRNIVIDHSVFDLSVSEDEGLGSQLLSGEYGRPNYRLDRLGKEYIDDNRWRKRASERDHPRLRVRSGI